MSLTWPCALVECISSSWKPEDACTQLWKCVDGEYVLESLSYASFARFTDEIAAVLQRQLLIFSGSCNARSIVGILWRPHVLASVSVHSVIKSGAAFYPVSFDAASNLNLFRDLLIAIICLCSSLELPDLPPNFIAYSEEEGVFGRQDWCLLLHIVPPIIHSAVPSNISTSLNSHLAYVITTSGSSGNSKKIVFVADSCISANIVDLHTRFPECEQMSPDDSTVLLTAPLTFDPSIVQIYFALLTHRTLIVPAEGVLWRPGCLSSLCIRSRVTWLQCTPSLFTLQPSYCQTALLAMPNLSILFGGEPFPLDLFRSLPFTPKAKLYNIYGVTEVSSWAAICTVGMSGERRLNPNIQCDCAPPLNGCTPIGFPMLATHLELQNARSGFCSALTVFRELGGFAVLDGSIKSVSNSQFQMMVDKLNSSSPWYTGDLAVMGRCSGCFWFCGREDRTYKRLGHQISLDRLENCILNCQTQNIRIRFCKCDLRLAPYGQVLTAVLGISSRSFEENRRLPRYHYEKLRSQILRRLRRTFSPVFTPWLPTRFVFRDKAALVSPHGKLVRCSRYPRVRPLGFWRTLVANIWAEAIGCSKRSIQSMRTFFDLGGSSLSALHMVELLVENVPGLSSLKERLLVAAFTSNFGEFVNLVHAQKRNCSSLLNSGNMAKSPLDLAEKIEENHSFRLPHYEAVTSGAVVYNIPRVSQEMHMEVTWKYMLGKCVDAPALVVRSIGDGLPVPVVCVGSHSTRFSALSLTSGTALWSAPTGVIRGRIEAGAMLGFSPKTTLVSVGTLDGWLHAFDLISGAHLWDYDTGGAVKSRATFLLGHGAFVLGSHGRLIHAIDPRQHKKPLWTNAFDNSPIVASVSYSATNLFVSSLGGSIGCIDVRSPQQVVWIRDGMAPFFSKAILASSIVEPHVLSVSVDGVVRSFCSYSGKDMWSLKLRGSILPSNVFNDPLLEVSERRLLVSSSSGSLFCVGLAEGTLHWEMNCLDGLKHDDPRQLSAPSLLVTQPSSPNGAQTFLALTRADGRVILARHPDRNTVTHHQFPMSCVISHQLPAACFASPTVYVDECSNGFYIVCGCRDDNLYCFSLSAVD